MVLEWRNVELAPPTHFMFFEKTEVVQILILVMKIHAIHQ